MAMIVHISFVFVTWLAHPFHVSVCDVEFNDKTKSLEISQRIFLDDLEEALRKKSGWTTLDVVNPSDKKRFDALMKEFVIENLSIEINNKPVKLSYLGHELESDAIWCYLEVTGVNNLTTIGVENSVLIDTFPDQVNLVHVKKESKIRSLKLYRDNIKGSIDY
ncbi:MAG: hypothetical protein RIG68_13795 [Imperialibacter sp.]|uniref:DUF6702 family protein n=1 Tax=Imperialibacter sp. TaxID=2038411 RepID=UPI0032F061C6